MWVWITAELLQSEAGGDQALRAYSSLQLIVGMTQRLFVNILLAHKRIVLKVFCLFWHFGLGDVEIGLQERNGQLEVDIIQARGLTPKPGSKTLPGSVLRPPITAHWASASCHACEKENFVFCLASVAISSIFVVWKIRLAGQSFSLLYMPSLGIRETETWHSVLSKVSMKVFSYLTIFVLCFFFSCLHQSLPVRERCVHCEKEDKSGPQIFRPFVQSGVTVPWEPSGQGITGKRSGFQVCLFLSHLCWNILSLAKNLDK